MRCGGEDHLSVKKEKIMAEEIKGNFIHDIIDEDLAQGVVEKIHTRFPPEPNGIRCV